MPTRAVRGALAFVTILGLLTFQGSAAPAARAGGVGAEPDLTMAPLRDFRIQWVNGRRMLRFTGMIVNIGAGPFELQGVRSSTSEPMTMHQIVYEGASSTGPIAQQYATGAVAQYAGDGHNHWHVNEIARYDLWGGPNVSRGSKIGFCFLDSDPHDLGLPGAPPSRYYLGSWCSTDPNALSNRMGISIGWGDLYAWNVTWQWIDITDLPAGVYVVRAMADPYQFFAETNDQNQCDSVQISWTDDSNVVNVEGQVASCLNDWSSSEFASDVEWLFQSGITTGCSHLLFCTEQIVPREQMASFLARARALPPPGGDHFWDDAGSFHEPDINRTAEAGVTNGCDAGRFCPTEGVTRAQMASFLARAFALPDATTDYFWDDAGSIHEADINRVAQAGITLGCGDGAYCGGNFVTRGQMAAFLHRAMTD
jgi:Lysyl oxidase/S-layer homology domain